jgi:hypothetical protein
MSDELERGGAEQKSTGNGDHKNPGVRGRPSSGSNANGHEDKKNASEPQQKVYAACKSVAAWVWLHLPRRKVWTVGATVVMAGAMIVYTVYAQRQWRVMDTSLRLDHRAWLSPSSVPNIPLEDGKPLVQLVILTNTGRTPAKKVAGRIVTVLVGRSEVPHFDYTHGVQFPAGIMFPNQPMPVSSLLIPRGVPQGVIPQPILMSGLMRQQIGAGQAFILTYGNITYDDVFGEHHWLHFCVFGPQETRPLYEGWKQCYQYNDDDSKAP